MTNREHHKTHRGGWLRAGVMGANDGIVSTASLVLGVAAASAPTSQVMVAGLAGLVAGEFSMGVGEYVSVASQRDLEQADLELERTALQREPIAEREELAAIYEERGLPPELAATVARTLMAKDALAAHARDELHMDPVGGARPMQAGIVSAISFSCGAALPLLAMVLAPTAVRGMATVGVALVALAGLGMWGAALGGARKGPAAVRVVLGGALAMAATAALGWAIGASL